jgi:hypothetical protein
MSAACNLPFTLRASQTPSPAPTLTEPKSNELPTFTSSPSATQTSLPPSPTASLTPSPTSDLISLIPTVDPNSMSTPNIPVTGNGSGGESTPAPVTFAPAADPDKIFIGGCGTNQTTITVAINRPEVVGTMLLFIRLDELPNGNTPSFGGGTRMTVIGEGVYQATITAPNVKPVGGKSFDTRLVYKFIVLDSAGTITAGSFEYDDIDVKVCKP